MADYQLTATGTVIRIADGAGIPNDPANRDRIEYAKWLAAGGVPDPYVPPDAPSPFLAPPIVVAAALGMVVSPEAFDISNPSGGGMFNIGAAMYIDVGTYWLFFVEPPPDDTYDAIITGGVQMTLGEHTTEYFFVEAKNNEGNPTDPTQFSVQIMRIAT